MPHDQTLIELKNIEWKDDPPSKVELRSPGRLIIDGVDYNFTNLQRGHIIVSVGPPIAKVSRWEDGIYAIELILSNYTGDFVGAFFPDYPTYLIWPNGESKGPQTITSTGPNNPSPPDKRVIVSKYKERISDIANYYDQQTSIPDFASDDFWSNTIIEWPKLIGLAWRAVAIYNDEEVDYNGLPPSINISNGEGIEDLITRIDFDFSIPKTTRHEGAKLNRDSWDGYKDRMEVWGLDHSNAEGDTLIYTASTEDDFTDLYTSYLKAVDYESTR